MKKILFICPYPEKVAAGQRLKFEPHFQAFKEKGFSIGVHSFMSEALWNVASKKGHGVTKIFWTLSGLVRRILLIRSIRHYDSVYIFMNVFPFGPPILEKIYLKLAKNVIYDIEDDLLSTNPESVSGIASILKSKSKTKYLIRNSNHVIASSPELANKCNAISQKNNAIFIPPTLESKRFHVKPLEQISDSKPVIGWTGTYSSREFLDAVIPSLEALHQKTPFKFMVIGNFDMKNKNLDMEVVQWEEKSEIEQLHHFDIGLYPLPDSDWIAGKSGLKALQYMAIGIPAVCSAVGNVLNIIEHDKDGILIYNTDQWAGVLGELLNNPEKRRLIGKNARDKFINNFSQEAIFQKYLSVLGD